MSVDTFIPELWSGLILRAQMKNLVYCQPGVTVNTDYQSQLIEMGDTIHIESISDPTISDYVRNVDMAPAEVLDGAERTLLIDFAKSWHFQIDDVDAVQSVLDFQPEALVRAGYRMKDATDEYMAAKMVAAATTNVIGSTGTPMVIDNSGAGKYMYDVLVKARIMLDEANVPTDGRFAIIPSWAEGSMDLDPRFVGLRGLDANAVLLNGAIGQAAGFNILKSNNVPFTAGTPGTDYKVICGVPSATSYVQQVNKVEAYRPQLRFSDAVKGLFVAGSEVVRPYQLAQIHVNDGLGLAGNGPTDPPA
jgi:hypothetical protein